jgi:antitoxin CcdA
MPGNKLADRRFLPPVKAEQGKRWLQDNRAAIKSINDFIAKHGLLASKLRYRPERE